MNINEVSKEIHKNNVEKGFWDNPRNTGEILMLVVSELSEALEADRKNIRCTLLDGQKKDLMFEVGDSYKMEFQSDVKDTFEDEIADAAIRLLDLAVGLNIDLEWHIKAKMRYNSLRPHMHGKKY